jgi:hypothetical protein
MLHSVQEWKLQSLSEMLCQQPFLNPVSHLWLLLRYQMALVDESGWLEWVCDPPAPHSHSLRLWNHINSGLHLAGLLCHSLFLQEWRSLYQWTAYIFHLYTLHTSFVLMFIYCRYISTVKKLFILLLPSPLLLLLQYISLQILSDIIFLCTLLGIFQIKKCFK